MSARIFIAASALLATIVLSGCKHPLAVVGEGDIVDVNKSAHGCTLEQFQTQNTACTENEVSGDYYVNYKAVPRPGWRFVRWDGPCSHRSDFQHCRLNISKAGVAWWDETYPRAEIAPSTAVFQQIVGETGYLIGPGSGVAGVAYETSSQRGVTGIDGSFQYEEGETVRFKIGDTVLGEITGQAQVTPFNLAGSAVLSGVQVSLGLVNPAVSFDLWGGDLYPAKSFNWQNVDAYSAGFSDDFFYRPNAFHTVVNLAVMLRSLDEDSDPENGIVITAGVADLFRGVSLNLRQEWNQFLSSRENSEGPGEIPTLRFLVGQANKKRLFDVAHGVIKPAVALQHLYKTLGIDSNTYAICPGGWDSQNSDVNCQYDANGNLTLLQLNSSRPPSLMHYKYDTNGNLVRYALDDGDGIPRRVKTWQYNARGNMVRATHYNDDIPDQVETWLYDRVGNVVLYEEDDGADGTRDQFETWKYDADGKPTRMEGRVADRGDLHTKSWEYWDIGKLRRYEEAYHIEANGDNSTQAWQYDANGRQTQYYQENVDTQIGTRFVSIETRKYDAQGSFTQESYFGEGESQPSLERVVRYQLDAKGNLVRYEQDNNADGVPGSAESWQYDENGNVVRYEQDDWANGKANYIETWLYDAGGNPTRAEGRIATGKLVFTKTWQYDADGKLSRYEEDEDADGASVSVQTWKYNASGDLTRHDTDRGDGETLIDNWLYDDDGKLTSFERNHDRFGTLGEIESWQFHTTGWGHIFSGLPPNLWYLYF